MKDWEYHLSFRFKPGDVQALDKIVAWERAKGPMLGPLLQATRTSVIKALIEREVLRLNEEADRMSDRIRQAKEEGRRALDRLAEMPESPKERKTRLQRERRVAKRVPPA